MLDIRQLQLFQHLAISLHFGKTATAMHVSPSTLSRAIQRLEDDCGACLFVRDNRKVALTAAGEKLLEFSQQTLQNWKQLKADIDQQSQLLRGELSLFCSVTASFSHLPTLLQQFTSQYPQVEINLTTGDAAQAEAKVLQNAVDVAIAVNAPDFPKELHFSAIDTIPLVLIAPAQWRISNRQQLDWRQMPMVLPESGPSRRIVHHWLAEHGIKPKVYATVAGHEAIVSMVALGCGLGIVPQVVVDNSPTENKVTVIPLEDIESFELGLCCMQDRLLEPIINAIMLPKSM